MKKLLFKVIILKLVSTALMETKKFPNSNSSSRIATQPYHYNEFPGTSGEYDTDANLYPVYYSKWYPTKNYMEGESIYGPTQKELNWTEAKRVCGIRGFDMLNLETKEEFRSFERWLKASNNTGPTYWLGGKYNSDNDSFFWDNGVPLSPDALWFNKDSPSRKEKTPDARILAITWHGNPITVKLYVNPENRKYRYICVTKLEKPVVWTVPHLCNKDINLVILVDASSYADIYEYEFAKTFAARLAVAWAANMYNDISVLAYGGDRYDIGLDIQWNKESMSFQKIEGKVRNMKYLGPPLVRRGNCAENGLKRALEILGSKERNPNIPKVVVFIPFGEPCNQDYYLDLTRQLALLRVAVFSVFSKSNARIDFGLLRRASGTAKNIFNITSIDEILAILNPFTWRVCEVLYNFQ